jgi:heat shock protein HslJ
MRAVFLALWGLVLAACTVDQSGRMTVGATPNLALAGTSWRLVEFQSPDNRVGTVKPDNPSAYTMALEPDGHVALRLNCNRGIGSWTATATGPDAGSFSFSRLAVTKAFCFAPSLDMKIARDAENVRAYVLRDGRLHLNLMADGGTYVWEPAGGPR